MSPRRRNNAVRTGRQAEAPRLVWRAGVWVAALLSVAALAAVPTAAAEEGPPKAERLAALLREAGGDDVAGPFRSCRMRLMTDEVDCCGWAPGSVTVANGDERLRRAVT